jgi:hypothetical protein
MGVFHDRHAHISSALAHRSADVVARKRARPR